MKYGNLSYCANFKSRLNMMKGAIAKNSHININRSEKKDSYLL